MKLSIRYFILGVVNDVDHDVDIVEVSRDIFEYHVGDIEYERHTLHQNGVDQICLTKDIIYNSDCYLTNIEELN